MIVLVTGGRDFDDAEWLETVLGWLPIAAIVEGCARGADRLAELYAYDHRITLYHYPADWKMHGKAAGLIRNGQMLHARPDLVVAFPGGRGTADMVRRAQAAGVRIIRA